MSGTCNPGSTQKFKSWVGTNTGKLLDPVNDQLGLVKPPMPRTHCKLSTK